MKIFDLISTKYDSFQSAVSSYLSKTLTSYSTKNSNIFTQLINVLGGVTQNIFSYIEDSLTEQNKYTATRKRSIYNLASISGYNPSTGTTTTMVVKVTPKPNNLQSTKVIIPNHTKLSCEDNGMVYNIVLPQESIIMDLNTGSSKYFTVVEGEFETQSFICRGGQLYTQNVTFNNDCDINFLQVYVNNELYEYADSLYDMRPDAKQYTVKTSLKKGIDITFGNTQYGHALNLNDVIKVEYLLHNGEGGNLTGENVELKFIETLNDTTGEYVDTENIFVITVENQDMVHSGTYSESLEQVREMIGLNSRSLVLADAKNYKHFLSRFSFCGYNRTWSEPGSLVVTSLIIKNLKRQNKDYFDLTESDFFLSESQKHSIINHLNNTGQQLAGTVLNIVDPVLKKYCMYVYVKLKDGNYNTDEISTKIKTHIGNFFLDIENDYFIPKSDIIHMLKTNIEEIDGVSIYILSEANETALIKNEYTNEVFTYNISTGRYDIKTEKIYLYDGENPHIGLDAHGNILLNNPNTFPVLMGGWQYISNAEHKQTTTVVDPVTIIFE